LRFNKKQCCQFFNKQYNLLNGVGVICHHQILVVIQRTLPDLTSGSQHQEKRRLVAALLYLSYFTRFVVVNYYTLERKVPKVQERNDIQHVSFIRPDWAFVLMTFLQLNPDA